MNERKSSFKIAIIPIIVLIILLTINVLVFKDDSSYGPNQLALLFSSLVSAAIGVFYLKKDYRKIEEKALKSVSVALQAILILLIVGSLVAIWILNGVVPTMIYYGIELINPSYFLPITAIICAIVSTATGSSWSTAGTVGIALIGIGRALNIPEGMVAGAIVSGAYFGDKMSPLSDTTNLAPAMAGTDLFTHIKHMVYTSGPAFIMAVIIYIVLGLFYSSTSTSPEDIKLMLSVIDNNFNISLWLFTLPLIVFALVYKKVPALPALLIGAILGIVYALIFQQDLLAKIPGGMDLESTYRYIIKVTYGGYELASGNQIIDKLLSRGGMSGMLNTIWLILMAMVFGGMMEATGMLGAIEKAILKLVSGVTSLVVATVGTAIFLNLTTSDQYIAIVVTGRMFKKTYEKMGLHPKNLSRAVEDSGTVTSVLVPWNTCGAYFATILGVSTLTYLPFAFFNLLSPVCSVVLAATGKTMDKLEQKALNNL